MKSWSRVFQRFSTIKIFWPGARLPGPSSARQIKKIIKNYKYSPGTLTRARFCLMMLNDLNRTPAMVPLAAPLFGVLFLRGHISLKNRSYRPLLRASTSPFKSTCLFIYLKEPPLALYRRYKYWQVPF
jgi:hypothetical protein